ncbi:MAG: acyltransferase family protein [Clostridium sp.]
MNLERDYYFDNLKGFLILSVIIGNSLELIEYTPVNTHYFILFLYMFHMPMFTFVSGYFSSKSKRSTQDKVKYTFKLYCLAQIFYYTFYKILFNDPTNKPELLAPEWTLWYLLSLTSWYILSDYINDRKKWIVYSAILSLFLGFDSSIGSLGSISRTIFFLPFFIGGMMFKKEHLNYIKQHIYKFGIGAILTLIILKFVSHETPVSLLFEYTKYTWVYDTNGFPFMIRLFHYIGAFLLGAIILICTSSKKTYLSRLGKSSLLLYLIHSGVSKAYFHYSLVNYDSIFNLFLSELIILATTITITLLSNKIKTYITNK